MAVKRILLQLVLGALVLLAGCSFQAEYDHPTLGKISGSGTIGHTGSEVSGGVSLGRGTAVLEDGDEFDGEYFDDDNDGVPDRFLPDAGQTGGGGSYGSTNGVDSFPISDWKN